METARINNKAKFVVMLSVLVVIAYALTQVCWQFFVNFGLWETWKHNIWLYYSLTKVAGMIFLVSTSTTLAYKLFRNQDIKKEETAIETKNVASNRKSIIKNLLHPILKKIKKAGNFLKKTVIAITRFLYRSRKTTLLVIAVVLVTLIFSLLLASWFNQKIAPNGEEEPTLPTTGTIKVQGLEIYGGDIKFDPESETVYVDWGELTLGVSKNASFYIKSTSNVDVELELNVTNWLPAGIEEYLTISWDYNGTLISPTQAISATVNLEVTSSGDFIDFLVENNVMAFGFDMNIHASEV